jgi:hypothetical protein
MYNPFQMDSSRFSVHYFVNNAMTATLENCTAEQAYREAVPGEAMQPFPGNRWHVMMRMAALTQLERLSAGQSVAVAWQDPAPLNPEYYDTERIVIVREHDM